MKRRLVPFPLVASLSIALAALPSLALSAECKPATLVASTRDLDYRDNDQLNPREITIEFPADQQFTRPASMSAFFTTPDDLRVPIAATLEYISVTNLTLATCTYLPATTTATTTATLALGQCIGEPASGNSYTARKVRLALHGHSSLVGSTIIARVPRSHSSCSFTSKFRVPTSRATNGTYLASFNDSNRTDSELAVRIANLATTHGLTDTRPLYYPHGFIFKASSDAIATAVSNESDIKYVQADGSISGLDAKYLEPQYIALEPPNSRPWPRLRFDQRASLSKGSDLYFKGPFGLLRNAAMEPAGPTIFVLDNGVHRAYGVGAADGVPVDRPVGLYTHPFAA